MLRGRPVTRIPRPRCGRPLCFLPVEHFRNYISIKRKVFGRGGKAREQDTAQNGTKGDVGTERGNGGYDISWEIYWALSVHRLG